MVELMVAVILKETRMVVEMAWSKVIQKAT
jgi:uncharacterized protein YmfQ (DUF2313 family)